MTEQINSITEDEAKAILEIALECLPSKIMQSNSPLEIASAILAGIHTYHVAMQLRK